MTALRRRWPRAVFRTIDHHGQDMERQRRGARHRPDRAFHNAPGFCPVCEVWIEPALDVHMHMLNVHLEMAQLWRCPVEWCAVWKGSVRACMEHLSEKHGGSSLFVLKNVARSPPPPLGLFPATSGRRLFWRWAPVIISGWTIFCVIRRLLPPCTYNGMWV